MLPLSRIAASAIEKDETQKYFHWLSPFRAGDIFRIFMRLRPHDTANPLFHQFQV
jgi:hypothetical protein